MKLNYIKKVGDRIIHKQIEKRDNKIFMRMKTRGVNYGLRKFL